MFSQPIHLPTDLLRKDLSSYLSDKDIVSIMQASRTSLSLFDHKETWANKIKNEFHLNCSGLPENISRKTLYKGLKRLQANRPKDVKKAKKSLNLAEIMLACCSDNIDYLFSLLPKLDLQSCLSFAMAAHSHHITDALVPSLVRPYNFEVYLFDACEAGNVRLVEKLIELGGDHRFTFLNINEQYLLSKVLRRHYFELSDDVILCLIKKTNIEELFSDPNYTDDLLNWCVENRRNKSLEYLFSSLERDQDDLLEFLSSHDEQVFGPYFDGSITFLNKSIMYNHSGLFLKLISLKDQSGISFYIPDKQTLLCAIEFADLTMFEAVLSHLPPNITLTIEDINRELARREPLTRENVAVLMRSLSHFKLTPTNEMYELAKTTGEIYLVKALLTMQDVGGSRVFLMPTLVDIFSAVDNYLFGLAEFIYDEIAETLTDDERIKLLERVISSDNGLAIKLFTTLSHQVFSPDEICRYFEEALRCGSDDVIYYLLEKYRSVISLNLNHLEVAIKTGNRFIAHKIFYLINIDKSNNDNDHKQKMNSLFIQRIHSDACSWGEIDHELLILYFKSPCTANPILIQQAVKYGDTSSKLFVCEIFKKEIAQFSQETILELLDAALNDQQDQVILALLKMKNHQDALLFTPTSEFLIKCVRHNRMMVIDYLLNLKNSDNEYYFDLESLDDRHSVFAWYRAFRCGVKQEDVSCFWQAFQSSPVSFYQQMSTLIHDNLIKIDFVREEVMTEIEIRMEFQHPVAKKIIDILDAQIADVLNRTQTSCDESVPTIRPGC